MDALRTALVAWAICHAAPTRAQPIHRWQGYVAEASARFGVPEAWIRRVIAAESGGRTTFRGRPIRSRAGAMGLMQLMPGTWAEMRARLGLGDDPDDPRDNIQAGTSYLREMYDRFGYPGLFAAYNAGPARYAHHLATGRRLPAETVAYVAKLTAGRDPPSPDAPAQLAAASVEAPPKLFAIRIASHSPTEPGGHAPIPPAPAGLFALQPREAFSR